MTQMPRILAAEPVVHGVIKVAWDDGYEGVIDLRGIMARGKMFTPLSDREYFRSVKVSDHGHSVFWGEPDHEDIDFGAERLRELAEQQAALLAHAN